MPLSISIVSAGLAHHGGTLLERSLGGSETAAICVARALARRGHRVTVFSPGHTGGMWDGVQYANIETAGAYLQTAPQDVTVVSRDPRCAAMPNQAGLTVLWCHDLAHKRAGNALTSAMWNIGLVYVLSAFQRQQYLDQHPALGAVVETTRNGVDLDWFSSPAPARDRWMLLYGSRPERGLEQALAFMRECWQRGLPWKLQVAGYENTTPEMAGYYQGLFDQAAALPNVEVLGPLLQAQWCERVRSVRAVFYPGCPTPFREISCIIAMEAQAAGTPFIGVAQGALPETVHGDAGILVGNEATVPGSREHFDALHDALAAIADDHLWDGMSEAGRAHAMFNLTWDGVAEQWETDFLARLTERQAEAGEVARELVRRGDAELAA